MLEFFQYVTSGPGVFFGFIILCWVFFEGVVDIIRAFRRDD